MQLKDWINKMNETIEIKFPSSWDRVRCEDWIREKDLVDIYHDISGKNWIFEVQDKHKIDYLSDKNCCPNCGELGHTICGDAI